jgi:phosphoribosylformylglycinamidine synthase
MSTLSMFQGLETAHWSIGKKSSVVASRDNVETADQEFALITDKSHAGIIAKPTFDLNEPIEAPYINERRPNMVILREQGVNGHVEMAAAFVKVGFNTVDVHMSDLLAGRISLDDFEGLVACGGFSYGDVMGAGGGWAKSVLFNPKLRDQFEKFFNRDETFSLGICNGCQMLSQLAPLIPGAEAWPRFHRNTSEMFEARAVNVRVEKSNSVLLEGMEGSILPIAVAHGEGRVVTSEDNLAALNAGNQVILRYVDSQGNPTQHYPMNPNGSPEAISGVTSKDGRATITMPILPPWAVRCPARISTGQPSNSLKKAFHLPPLCRGTQRGGFCFPVEIPLQKFYNRGTL